MSCSDTPVNRAVTGIARKTEPTLTRTQISSLFHQLKREGRALGAVPPDRAEYLDGLDVLRMRAQFDPKLEPADRDRAIAQFSAAANDNRTPNGPTWYAINQIQSQARVAAQHLDQKLETVANDMGMDPKRVREFYEIWRDNPTEYEDMPAPDPQYRYDQDPAIPTDHKTQQALRKLGYEHFLNQPLPVFVYGSLRRGQHNHGILQDATVYGVSGNLEGVAVYGSRFGFPYAAEHDDQNAVTVGEVFWLSENHRGSLARANLDRLEGFNSDWPSSSHYERVARDINVMGPNGATGTTRAWVYLARGHSRAALSEHDRIHHGDWVAAKIAAKYA